MKLTPQQQYELKSFGVTFAAAFLTAMAAGLTPDAGKDALVALLFAAFRSGVKATVNAVMVKYAQPKQ